MESDTPRAVPAAHRHRSGEGAGPRGLAAADRAPVRPAPLVRRRRHRADRRVVGGGDGLAVPAARRHRRRPAAAGPRPCSSGSSSAWSPSPAVTAALGVVQTWISTTVGQQVMHRLRTDVFAHLQRQSIAFFTRTRTGEVQSRITNDIGGMQSVVTSTATSVASNLTTAVATARRDARAELAAHAGVAARAAAVDLADPPGRPHAPRRSPPPSSASWPTSTSRSRRASRSAACCSPSTTRHRPRARSSGSPRRRRGWSTSSCAPSSPGAGGWPPMSVVFAAIPAVIYLGAGLPVSRPG